MFWPAFTRATCQDRAIQALVDTLFGLGSIFFHKRPKPQKNRNRSFVLRKSTLGVCLLWGNPNKSGKADSHGQLYSSTGSGGASRTIAHLRHFSVTVAIFQMDLSVLELVPVFLLGFERKPKGTPKPFWRGRNPEKRRATQGPIWNPWFWKGPPKSFRLFQGHPLWSDPPGGELPGRCAARVFPDPHMCSRQTGLGGLGVGGDDNITSA